MGEAGRAGGLSDAAGGCAARRFSTRFSLIGDFLACRSGATAVEYGLIVALIFLVIVASVQLFAANVTTKFNNISTAVTAAS